MRVFVMLLFLSISRFTLAQPETPVAPKKDDAVSDKLTYEAHWLLKVDEPTESSYQMLLVTKQPLEQLANLDFSQRPHSTGFESAAPLPFDHPAFTFRTYGKDSLWSDPYRCVKKLGPYHREEQTLELNGAKFKVAPCSLKELIGILENPLGMKKGVHRLAHPLHQAELTNRAFIMLLKEQLVEPEKERK